MTVIYAILAVISVVLLIGYSVFVGKKEPWLFLLYICIPVVNIGYFLLSISKNITFAIIANDIAYLGSVFLSMCMFLTIYGLCGFKVTKRLAATLIAIGAAMFLVVATSGFLPWYYKEVSLTYVDGAVKLEKEYGVLHSVYLVYIVAYFTAMVICIVRSVRRKMIASQKHATLLAVIVFGNIGVWFVEKFIRWNFEFLSVSYLFSELMLLGIYWMVQDYRENVQDTVRPVPAYAENMPVEEKMLRVMAFLPQGQTLTTREREILERILVNKKRADIADELGLSENTVKTHTRNLYGKLCIASRDELYALLIK